MKLNTENNNCFIYETEELLIELLGGVRIDTLDRMRVTIKVTVVNRKHPQHVSELSGLAVRHNLDLYNDTQVEKFIRRVAEKLEVGSVGLIKAIADITGELEVYRLTMLDKKEDKPVKKLTEQERKDAMQFLQSKDLLQTTNDMIGKSGVIGEEVNRLLMYLIFTSRKREHPLHIISLGSSGIGKTYLQEKVGELIPVEDKVEITTLSENAFYYFGQRELTHKLLLIEDLDGSNAKYQLTGTDKTNQYFQFKGFDASQGGKNEVNISGAVTGAQDYVTNNYDKCNQSVNFVGRTYNSAANATGQQVDGITSVNGNNLARGITADLVKNRTAETSVASAQESANNGNLVVGANGGHVVTMTTKTFDVTRYDATGKVIETKQIGGGKTANVNGTARPTNIGPGKLNSFQNPNYSNMKWYSFPVRKR